MQEQIELQVRRLQLAPGGLAIALGSLSGALLAPRAVEWVIAPKTRTLAGAAVAVALVVAVAIFGAALVLGVGPAAAAEAGRAIGRLIIVAFFAGLVYLTPPFTRTALTAADLAAIAEWLEARERAARAGGAAMLAAIVLECVATL